MGRKRQGKLNNPKKCFELGGGIPECQCSQNRVSEVLEILNEYIVFLK